MAIGAKANDGNGDFSGHVRVFDISPIILSIPTFDLENIVSIFPNPSKDVINITSKTDMILKTELYSLEGILIFKTDIKANTYSLDIADYPSGTYFLKIFGQNSGILNSKIIKN